MKKLLSTCCLCLSLGMASSSLAGNPVISVPGVEIGADGSISAPGVQIKNGSITAPGVKITKDTITAPGVEITTQQAEEKGSTITVTSEDQTVEATLTGYGINGDNGEHAIILHNNDELDIAGDNNDVAVNGQLGKLKVSGDGNTIVIWEQILALDIYGDNNDITLPRGSVVKINNQGTNNDVVTL